MMTEQSDPLRSATLASAECRRQRKRRMDDEDMVASFYGAREFGNAFDGEYDTSRLRA